MSANQKTGVLENRIAIPFITLSNILPSFVAEIMPSATPNIPDNNQAIHNIHIEFVSLCVMT